MLLINKVLTWYIILSQREKTGSKDAGGKSGVIGVRA